MRTIVMYGVIHAYPSENEKLPKFLRDCCKAIELTVPLEEIDSYSFIEKRFLEEIKKDKEESVRLSWIENPEQMGR